MYAFFVTAQLVAVVADIPYDDPAIWSKLRTYAEEKKLFIAEHMKHPHPSFVFPLLLEVAFSKGQPGLANYDLTGMVSRADRWLSRLGLPNLATLRLMRKKLHRETLDTLGKTEVGLPLAMLLKEMRNHSSKLMWHDRLANPMKGLQDILPVPVLFSDHTLFDGSTLSYEESFDLQVAADRCSEVCAFYLNRDVVV